MHTRTVRSFTPVLGVAILSLGAFAAPAVSAAPAQAVEGAGTCEVAQADLSWGVKESFRSYISGSIANGGWETSDGAEYETPNFLWKNGAGSIGSGLESGSIAFTGGVHFSGHEGALKFDLANPTIEFSGTDSAYLLLDIGATDTAQEGAPQSAQVRAAKLDLSSGVDAEGQQLALQNVTVRLTSEGAAAFNGNYGSYAAGDELDPISLNATVSGCELGAMHIMQDPEPGQPGTEEPEAIAAPPQTVQVPWLPIVIAGIALVVIGVTAGVLIAGRQRGDGSAESSAGSSADPGAEPGSDAETTSEPTSADADLPEDGRSATS